MKALETSKVTVLKCTELHQLLSGVWRCGLNFVVLLNSQYSETPGSRKSFQFIADSRPPEELMIPTH